MIDFFVLGAVKAGTTSLHHYLQQHPEIEMSAVKWTRYFHLAAGRPDFENFSEIYGTPLLNESVARYRMICNSRVPSSFDQYLRNWDLTRRSVIRGEISPTYMYDERACVEIKRCFPAAKIIVILREPVQRAISHFVMDRAYKWVPEGNILASFAKEPWAVNQFWWGLRHYLRHGLYSRYFTYLIELFSKDNLRIVFYEDLVDQPETFMKGITDFLGVEYFPFDFSIRHNSAPQTKPDLTSSDMQRLTDFFYHDRKCLESIVNVDLDFWK